MSKKAFKLTLFNFLPLPLSFMLLVKCRNIENNWIFELFIFFLLYFAACAIFPHLRIFLSYPSGNFFFFGYKFVWIMFDIILSFFHVAFTRATRYKFNKMKKKNFKRAKIEFNFMKFKLRGLKENYWKS